MLVLLLASVTTSKKVEFEGGVPVGELVLVLMGDDVALLVIVEVAIGIVEVALGAMGAGIEAATRAIA